MINAEAMHHQMPEPLPTAIAAEGPKGPVGTPAGTLTDQQFGGQQRQTKQQYA